MYVKRDQLFHPFSRFVAQRCRTMDWPKPRFNSIKFCVAKQFYSLKYCINNNNLMRELLMIRNRE